MFNIYLKLNYGISCTVENHKGEEVRVRHGEEVLINRTLYNRYKDEMCSAPLTIANKKIVSVIPRFTFRFKKVSLKEAKAASNISNDNIQTN